MTDVPSTAKTLADVLIGIPKAGRKTLLTALNGLDDARFPDSLRLCVLDAERLDAPAQIALLDELAAAGPADLIFALNKADRIVDLRTAIAQTQALLRERGFSRPVLYPVCAAAAKLLTLPAGELTPKQLAAQEGYYERFAPGENSLSAFALTGEPPLSLGSREIKPLQRALAFANTGVPALAAAIAAMAQEPGGGREPGTGNREQGTGNREQGTGDDTSVSGAPDAPTAPDDTPVPDAPSAPSETALAVLLADAESADCAKLLALARSVKNDPETPDELREQALDRLHAAYLAREAEELERLTLQTDELDLSSLRSLADRITAGPYTVQNRSPYLARLNTRIDSLQAEELAELCAGVEEADSRSLNRIRKELERVDCAEHLKAEYFRRIDARQEALDVEALDRVTAGAENMTEKELQAVAITLEANNWNPKYVGQYRHKIELCREMGRYREVNAQLAELDDMERRELIQLRDKLEAAGLPPRFTVGALRRIDEKIFRLDMLRLLALNNDFNSLDFDAIDELRTEVGHSDACDRAKQHYLGHLMARERALILENCSARAALTRQLIARHKLRIDDFCFPNSQDYEKRLDEFWRGSGLEQPRDLPVFLFDNGSQFAISASRFYFKAGRHLDCVPVENVDHFQVMKQHMSLFLHIVGKDSSYRLTEARISRIGTERILEFLNDCVRQWAEPGPPEPLPANLRVRRPDPAEYTAPVPSEPLTPRVAWELFCEAYDAAGLREGNLIRMEESSMQRLPKLRLGLGLPENTPVIWYASASRLGPVKEGVAVGSGGIYSKEGKDPVRSVSTEEIADVRASGSRRMTVLTLDGQHLYFPVSDDMAPLIADYFRAIQLGQWLQSHGETP